MPDLMTTFKFALEVGGVQMGTFRKASGIESESETIEFKEVTKEGKVITRFAPGARKYTQITFERRLDGSSDLWSWRKQVEDGDIDKARRDGSIVVRDSMDKEVARWNFVAGWPCKWTGAELDAGANEIATESVTIAHEGLERA